MNAIPHLLYLCLTLCGTPVLSRSGVLREEPPFPGVLERIHLHEIVQEFTGPIDRLAMYQRHPNHQALGGRASETAVGSRHRQWWAIAPVPSAERATFKENVISAIEGAIRRRGATLGEVSRGDETFESTAMFAYIMKRTNEADLVGSLVLSMCRLGEDVRVSLAGMEVETDIGANMARKAQTGEIRSSYREFWQTEPTAEDRRRGAVNEVEAVQQRFSREQHGASEAAADRKLKIDDLAGILGIRYYKARVLLPLGQSRLRFRIVKTGPGEEAKVVEEMPLHFRPAEIDPNSTELLLYFVDDEGSPIGAEMVSDNGETRYVFSLQTRGRNAGSGTGLGGTVSWVPHSSDGTRGGSNECHPVDLRSQPELTFLTLSRGEYTLEFRMAVDDAAGSE